MKKKSSIIKIAIIGVITIIGLVLSFCTFHRSEEHTSELQSH